MSASVFIGVGRKVTPGACLYCGSTEDWEADGRDTIFCSCQRCPECGEHEGHAAGCSERTNDDE